jgi:peptidoglycan hydrolase-like protein with peptidoglycan-binding domain
VAEDARQDARQDARRGMLPVSAAAERLGISKEAVRKRISRGTLTSAKYPDGTVRVYIPASSTASSTAPETVGRDELVELLRAQLEDLRADRDAWRDQARRSDYMATAAMDRTRELESRLRELDAPATQEPTEAPAPVEEGPKRAEAEPQPVTAGPQTAPQRPQGVTLRGLRRRILGW